MTNTPDATNAMPVIAQLDARSREVFRLIVDAFVDTGEPVGSRTLSRRMTETLSPATIRNVMADLEDMGLLYAPHTSAGRLPTDAGVRLFVNGLLEVGALPEDERRAIAGRFDDAGRNVETALEEASAMLAGLSRGAGVVVAPTSDQALKHVEFVPLNRDRALCVMVAENGMVENRIIPVPKGLPRAALEQAANYLNDRLNGRTVTEARTLVADDLAQHRTDLDELTARVVEAGLATWNGEGRSGTLIVRGQSKLLEDISALHDLERIRQIIDMLETKEQLVGLLDQLDQAEGVQIFIGSDNALFGLSGTSMIVAPYRDEARTIIGAIGVIGPTRLNYGRIIPVVDYTARLLGRLMG